MIKNYCINKTLIKYIMRTVTYVGLLLIALAINEDVIINTGIDIVALIIISVYAMIMDVVDFAGNKK